MALTDTAIRNAKPREKPYKMGDALGLFLLVQPSGGNGTHIHVSSKHLPKYLGEFECRWNMRHVPHLMLDHLMVSFAR